MTMKKVVIKKYYVVLVSVVILVLFAVFSIRSLSPILKINENLFKLSADEVKSKLVGKISFCTKLIECKLIPGDILLRRHITSKTWTLDTFAHLYFTHSAFYLGDDQIVEAVGTENNPQDEISISTLSKSDWFDSDLEKWVIIRPQNISSKIDSIKATLIAIANDPDYSFGVPEKDNKKTDCADLIFRPLVENNIIDGTGAPKIITPDYLFWLATEEDKGMAIVGFD